MKKIVDISGFGHSGKTSVTDYLKQFSNVYSFPNHVEFELFRVAGGLVDLYQAVYQNWNLIRSTARIKEFQSLIKRIGTVQSKEIFSSLWQASGHGYNQYFNDKFISISNDFVEKLIKDKQTQFWPYELLRISEADLFLTKLKRKILKKEIEVEVLYTERADFLNLVAEYIDDLFNEVGGAQHTHMVLNNAFEPFNPDPCLNMVPNSVGIVVDRDPRDIYASMINFNEVYIPEFEKYNGASDLKRNLTGFNDIDYFISRYKMLRNNLNDSGNNRILRVNFEEFVLNNKECSKRITDFIGLNQSSSSEVKIFDAEKSKKNVGVWKKYADSFEIRLIEEKLGQFCYNNEYI